MSNFPNDLIENYKSFRQRVFARSAEQYEDLAEGQSPDTMIISCCDSRVDPETIFLASPGKLFVVRNVANLVPPFETHGKYHGVSAAIEFAVLNLKIKNLIVMGHSGCGGISAALDSSRAIQTEANFISKWMSLLDEPKAKVANSCGCNHKDAQSMLEKEGVKHSISNLRTFPCVKILEDKGKLGLYGAFFDIKTGDLQIYNKTNDKFESV